MELIRSTRGHKNDIVEAQFPMYNGIEAYTYVDGLTSRESAERVGTGAHIRTPFLQ